MRKFKLELMDKLLTRRNIFMVLGVVVGIELLWAGWSLIKSNAQFTPTIPVTDQTPLRQTAVTLSSSKTEYKVGDAIIVDINIFSTKQVDGADLIISFDPKVLTVKPVTLGTIFSDYPQNTIDATLGKVSISGITAQPGGVKPNGEFGKLNFVVKAAGVAKISFDFTPGQTVDTNLIESGTGKDILETVNELEINIAQ